MRQFNEFYKDVHPEFRACGPLVQFKVCRNNAQHLRGNVYAQYENVADAARAIQMFTGRFYAGRQLFPEYVPVLKWRSAICGVYLRIITTDYSVL